MRSLAAAILVLLFGCTITQDPLRRAMVGGALESSRGKWEEAGMASYTYHYSIGCFCSLFSGVVRVEDGRVVSAVSDDGMSISPDYLSQFPTIEDLFDRIEAALRGDQFSVLSDVEFDATLGYPRSYSAGSSLPITDNGLTVVASDLTPL